MTERKITKRYPKEDIHVVWQPHLCMHSTKCFHGLPTVFDPSVRPWVNPEGATKEDIIAQVNKCPSGALSIQKEQKEMTENTNTPTITVAATGPYLVKGSLQLMNDKGEVIEKKENFALCRCGHSKNKPFCDGSHKSNTEWL